MMLLCRPWSRCITMRHVFNKCLRNQCSALRNNEREHVEPGGRPRWWQCPVDCWQGQALQVSACVLILVNYESCTLIFFIFFLVMQLGPDLTVPTFGHRFGHEHRCSFWLEKEHVLSLKWEVPVIQCCLLLIRLFLGVTFEHSAV